MKTNLHYTKFYTRYELHLDSVIQTKAQNQARQIVRFNPYQRPQQANFEPEQERPVSRLSNHSVARFDFRYLRP